MFIKSSFTLAIALVQCISGTVGIINGFDMNITQVPWQVSLQIHNGKFEFCAGAIISNRWVLTSARCLEVVKNKRLHVRVGATHVHEDGQLIDVEQRIMHENFDQIPQYRYDYDYGLIKLATELEFNEKVNKIDLPKSTDANVEVGTLCLTAGWGSLSNGAYSKILQGVELPIFDQNICKKLTYYDGVTLRMICAGFAEGGKNFCNGDQGGALVSYESDKPVMIGIASWTLIGCSQPKRPGVFARTSAALEWIHTHTQI